MTKNKDEKVEDVIETIEYNLSRGLYVRHAQVKVLFEEYKKLKQGANKC